VAVVAACVYIWTMILRVPDISKLNQKFKQEEDTAKKAVPCCTTMRNADAAYQSAAVVSSSATAGKADDCNQDLNPNPEIATVSHAQDTTHSGEDKKDSGDFSSISKAPEVSTDNLTCAAQTSAGVPIESSAPAESTASESCTKKPKEPCISTPEVDRVEHEPKTPASGDAALEHELKTPASGDTVPELESLNQDCSTKPAAESDQESCDEEERQHEEEEEAADPERAQELRQQGNEYFKAGKLHDAREAYSEAIFLMPAQDKKEKAILYSNRAACLQKISRWDDVVEDCKLAIELDPDYVKAYVRRSAAYEKLDKWNDAHEDLKKAAELDPTVRSREYKRLAFLEKRAAEQFEKDKTEMMSKLKDLGNTVLGKFGMSVDNFKMEQDPNTGSYSVKFQS